jgi:integrase/recombinase XerD
MTRKLLIVTQPAPSELEVSVSDYLSHCKARGLSRKTVDHYHAVLAHIWLPFLAAEKVTTAAAITQRTLDRLSTQMLDDGGAKGQLSRHSIHSYLRAIGSYLKWARAEGEITSSAHPQLPKRPHRVLNVLTREQLAAMEDAAATERDKLLIRTLADTGVRLSELLGLTRADLIEQQRDHYLRVMGKGSRQRLVPVQPRLFARLRRYVDRGRPKDVSTDRIFITLRKNRTTGDYEPLGTRAVQELTAALADQAGITDRPVNPHSFRHAFATHCLRRGMNPLQLQTILGHADLSMIQSVYAHLAPADAAAALMAVLSKDED